MDMGQSEEKSMFKTIMCPMKDKCPKILKPSWPTSNISAVTQAGANCPYAHHPMELVFPESMKTKLASSQHTIRALQQKQIEEKPKAVFKPSGGLFNCKGCFNLGQCNMCRYKKMALDSNESMKT